ncbi:biotin lipoate a b protein ligase protein [Apiospora arundinis]
MATSGTTEVITSNFITPVAQNIEKAGQPNEPIIKIPCPICWYRDLDVSTRTLSAIRAEYEIAQTTPDAAATSKEKFYDKYDLERTVILNCGHLVGRECYEIALDQPDFQSRYCSSCRQDNLCTGCPDYVLYDHAFDPVAWPLDPASYNPHRKFMSEVGLTAPERGDDESLLPPPPEPAAPHLHQAWRQLWVDEWLRRKMEEISNCVLPPSSDIRDPQIAAAYDAQANMQRMAVRGSLLSEPTLAAVRRLAFRPCRGDGAQAPVPLSAQETVAAFMLAEQYVQAFYKTGHAKRPVLWFRGDSNFELHPPSYQAVVPGQAEDVNKAIQNLLMYVGVDTLAEVTDGRMNELVSIGAEGVVEYLRLRPPME